MKCNKRVDLRIGIISDIHLGFTGHGCPNYYGLGQEPFGSQELWWEYALRYFKSRGVDAVVLPGDMANACRYDENDPLTQEEITRNEMRRCGEIFRKVFADTDTQLIAIYGNHDNVVQRDEKENGGDFTPWEDAFHEPYSKFVLKYIKGFAFIGGHWGHEALCREAIKSEAEKNPDKPVFYIQHGAIKNTTCDSFMGGQLYDLGRELVFDYDNVIALFGHTHSPITDERSIWQSAKDSDPKCTVISCSTLNYAYSFRELVRGENLLTKHGMILEVSGDKINVERLSFYTPEMLSLARGEKQEQNMKKCTRSCGRDWTFTLKGKEMNFEKRSLGAIAPEFPEGAMAGIARSSKFFEVHFPAATPLDADNDFVHSYYAEAYDEETGELAASGSIFTEFHVDHSTDYFSPYYQITLYNLKPDTKYKVMVYARDCWQKKSLRPLIRYGKTLKEDEEFLK